MDNEKTDHNAALAAGVVDTPDAADRKACGGDYHWNAGNGRCFCGLWKFGAASAEGRHTFTYTVSRFEDAKRLALKCAIAGQVAIAEGDARTISKGELLLEAAKTIEALVALADGNQTTTQSSVHNRGSEAP